MDLIQEIEKQILSIDQLLIYFIGQSGYVLKTKDCTLYLDPYLSNYIENPKGLNVTYMIRNYPTPFLPEQIQTCNGIICTHAHVDHMDPWTLEKINTNFQFYSSIGAYEKSIFNLDASRIVILSPQEKYRIGPFTMIPFPAAHYELTDSTGRPDCLSILIKWQEKILFFWGDGIGYQGQIDLLSPYTFDYFFAPINGRDPKREKMGIIGNIKEKELAEICQKLSIKHIIPNHYDMFKNNTGSVSYFKNQMKKIHPDQSIIVLECGGKIEI